MKIFTLIVAALLLAVPAVAQTSVYVFTQEAEFVDEGSKQRADTVEDLRKALNKKKALTVVETEGEAQIVLEVLARGRESTGKRMGTMINRPPLAGGGIWTSSEDVMTGAIAVALTVDSYSTELTAEADQAFGKWTAMANDIAKQVERWTKDNAVALVAEPHIP
jgi:hypothetical protein